MAEMVTFLITSFVILGLLSVAVYFWQKPASSTETRQLPREPQRRSLFGEDASAPEDTGIEQSLTEATQREEILARARAGQKSALKDAITSTHSGLYEQALDLLTDSSDGPLLFSLISYIARNDLPVSTKLAEKFMASWKHAPDRNSTAKMLHVAALANDARTYAAAVEVAVDFWRNGQISSLSGQELRALIDGEFWILSLNERSSGAGFSLKQTLAHARRELANERIEHRVQ